jgi:hypothetical protein
MQTATYIDAITREAVRSRSMQYIETEAAPGLTLAAYRRPRRPAGASSSRVIGVGRRSLARLTARYPDDPVGDYETTSGGW